jgi:hypothetical protein
LGIILIDWTLAAFSYTAKTGGLKESVHNIQTCMKRLLEHVGCELRHADANNEVIRDFDEKTVRSHIMAIDCNAQYSYALSCPVGVGDYKILSADKVHKSKFTSYKSTDKLAYILHCDIYSESVRLATDSLPLVLHKRSINPNELHTNQQSLYADLHKEDNDPLLRERLVLDVNDKDNVYVHSACLQYYLEEGLIIQKVHKVLQIKQKTIFGEFEEKVSDLRADVN